MASFHPESGLFPPWRCQSSGLLVRRTVVRLRAISRFSSQNEKILASDLETVSPGGEVVLTACPAGGGFCNADLQLLLSSLLLYLDGDVGRRLRECKAAISDTVPDFLGNVLLKAITRLVSDQGNQ